MSPRKPSRRTHRVFVDDAPARTFSLSTHEERGALNYIFDGGMRIEFRTNREASLARRRRMRVWRVLGVLALAWLVFQFIPT
jgi:hypothetical protein